MVMDIPGIQDTAILEVLMVDIQDTAIPDMSHGVALLPIVKIAHNGCLYTSIPPGLALAYPTPLILSMALCLLGMVHFGLQHIILYDHHYSNLQ